MGYELTDYEYRMLRDKTPLGAAFRAGASCEARSREACTVLHKDLIDYVRALAEHHPDWPSSQVADQVARVFAADAPVKAAAEVQLRENQARHDAAARCDGCSEPNRCGCDWPVASVGFPQTPKERSEEQK